MGDNIYIAYDVINRVCAMPYKQWCVVSKCGCDVILSAYGVIHAVGVISYVHRLWCHQSSFLFFRMTVQNLFIFRSKYCIVISDGVILSLFSLLVIILQLQIPSLESYAVSIRDSQIQDRWLQMLDVTLHCHVWSLIILPVLRGKSVWRSLKKLEIELPYDPAIPLLGIHTKDTRSERDTSPQYSSQHCLS